MAKGIRVNQLAKELGVESKAILRKLHDENIPNVPNHMSLISLGLAETVREWVRDGTIPSGGGVAVETEAAPSKAKPSRKKKTPGEGDAAHPHDGHAHDEGHPDAHADDAHPGESGATDADGSAAAASEPQYAEAEYAQPTDGSADGTDGDQDLQATAQGGDAASTDADSDQGQPVYEAVTEAGGGDADANATFADSATTTTEPSGSASGSGDVQATSDASAHAGSAPTTLTGDAPAAPAPTPVPAPKVPVAAKPIIPPAPPLRPPVRVGSVAFQPAPAKLVGPKTVVDKSPLPVSRPTRFGQKVSQPQGPGKPAAPVVAPPAPGKPGAPVAKTPPGGIGRPGVPGSLSTPPAPPPAPVAPPAPPAPVAPPAPAAGAPPAAPGGPGAPAGPNRGPAHNRLAADGSVLRQEQRPTVSLNNPASLLNRPPAERKPVVVAQKLTTLEPAKIQGPRIIRVEKPEPVAAPRPRGPMRPDQGPSLTPARPGVGRGVRSTTGTDDEETEAKKAAAKNRNSLSARRRGLDGRRGEAEERLKEFTEADLIARKDMLNAAAATRAGIDSHLKKTGARGTHLVSKTAVQRGGELEVEEPITVKSLSAALGVKSNEIIVKLMRKKIMATINAPLSIDQATEIALDYGLELTVAQEVSPEEKLMIEYDEALAESEDLVSRPPVVTILGHVDHGKTSLLDKIRSANVAAGEAGGITQKIAAWTVTVNTEAGQKRVTFIDTPGHQAFTSMRARGANMTDVVVLVVSAAEGVQPQTIESINHAKAADVPIIVAMNKIDRPDANPDMILGQLAANGLNPVEWGGDTEVVRVSALTGQGIPELLELLDYQSQLLDLKADPTLPPRGTVIEASLHPGLGPVATLLVQQGTLSVGDYVLCGPGYGRVRSLLNDTGKMIPEAGPAMPVVVSGLSEIPSPGDVLIGVVDLEEARAIAQDRVVRSRQKFLASTQQRTTGANIIQTIKAGEVQTINLIVKAESQGSVETLLKTVTDSNTEEVKVRVIHSGVGAVTESDVELAMATKTKPTDNRVAIVGFNVVPDETARALAEQNHVDVKTYRVIYEIFDDLKKALSGMLAPEEREKYHGRTEIRQVFKVSRMGNIAGCMVIDGHIQRGSKIRLIRNGTVIVEDLTLESLKRVKDDVKEVKQGFECGLKIANYDDIKVGDILEAYIKETFERTL